MITPRTVRTGLGYGFYSTGLPIANCAPVVSGTGTAQTTTGCGVASNMTNVVVDDTHHVTSFHLNDGNANIDAINYDTDIETWNWQTGLEFNRDGFKAEVMYGDSGSTFQRGMLRTAVNYTYGGVDAHITPSGLWSYTLPARARPGDLALCITEPRHQSTGGQRHQRSGGFAGLRDPCKLSSGNAASGGAMGQQLHHHLAPDDVG